LKYSNFSNFFILFLVRRSSGVVRVPCALEQKIFLRPPSTKLTEFEFKKIGAKVRKKHFLVATSFFFERNKMHLALETNSTKL